MNIVYNSCCGIDVHKNKIVACLKVKGKQNVIKEFSGQTEDIRIMADWIVDEYMKEYEKNKKKLEKMPGLGKRTSEVILAEIGQDMSRFPTSGHLCSWAGVCPGNNESAGKRRHGKTRNGNKTLKSILVECAQAASKHKDSFFIYNIKE